MPPDAFSRLIVLYDWFLLVGLIVFLLLIARFYQRFSGEKTHFRLYLIPIVLFGAQAIRQSNFSNDPLGSLLAAAGGIILLGLSLFLYWRMTAGRGAS
ncbi:MAG TPA: hypothetical protein VHD90_21035 [Phototrophicaceae bacterium]|nr:hypothetical protein [Phototrophicaceae bacterium]